MIGTRLALSTVLLALLTAVPASAQISDAQASRMMRSAAKQIRKAAKQELTAQRRVFELQLALYEDEIADLTHPATAMRALAEDLDEMVLAHRRTAGEARNQLTQTAWDVWEELGIAGYGTYPVDLSVTVGSVVGRFDDEIAAELEKSAARVRRSLARTAKRIEKQAGWSLTARIPSLAAPFNVFLTNPPSGGIAIRTQTTIHAVLATSQLSVEGDGTVCASGTNAVNSVTVEIAWTGAATMNNGSRLWSWCAISIPEGNRLVSVDGGFARAQEGIGVR